MTDTYDVAVIGSGPGGYVAGIKAAQGGLKSVVIERDRLGGICLNWGCIPTKALLRDAELYATLQRRDTHGFTFDKLGFDAERIVASSRKAAEKMNRGVASLFRKYKVEHIQGTAAFAAPQQLEIATPDGKTRPLQAKDVILATGARPRAIPAFPVDKERVITYREALELTQFPERLLIVGAGAIGVEFAYYFNAFGVEVHLVEMMPRLLPNEDAEIAELLLKGFQRQGIHCYPETTVKRFAAKKTKLEAALEGRQGQVELSCDMALIAIGMAANTDQLGAEKIGLALEKGFVRVNERMQTNVPHVYAIGDVAGRQLLAHKASAEAELAVAAILGRAVHPIDYGQVPACTYCQPQVASIGLTEQQCEERGIACQIGRFPFSASGKAAAIRHQEGLVKLIFGRPYGQLLGAHLIGPEVTELIAELGLAMRLEATNEEILATIHAHPTLSETIFEATGVAYATSANL
jgi:dihydrolipoamide dehydrogenase